MEKCRFLSENWGWKCHSNNYRIKIFNYKTSLKNPNEQTINEKSRGKKIAKGDFVLINKQQLQWNIDGF